MLLLHLREHQKNIDKLHDVFKAALESPDNIEKSKNANLPLKYMSPEELAQYIKDQENIL